MEIAINFNGEKLNVSNIYDLDDIKYQFKRHFEIDENQVYKLNLMKIYHF